MAAALVAKGSGDTDPRTSGGRGGLKGQCLGSALTPWGPLQPPERSPRRPPSFSFPSQLATRLNSQYLPTFMFPRQEGSAPGGPARLPNLSHSHGNRGEQGPVGASRVFLFNDRKCRLCVGRLPRALEENCPQTLSDTRGVPGRPSVPSGRRW